MRIAYLILAHRYPRQLIRLVERLDGEEVIFLVHLDAKMAVEDEELVMSRLGSESNVIFIRRFRCAWGGFGIVQATFQGIAEAIERGLEFDYLALLSGQDYPIKKPVDIERFLEENEGKSFIHYHPFPYNRGWDRVETWNIVREGFILTIPNRDWFRGCPRIRRIWKMMASIVPARKFPAGLHPCSGAQFWCLHKTHVRYVYEYVIRNPEFYRFFRFVFVSDEIFFQTILGNAPFTDEIVRETLTYVEWNRPGAILLDSDFETISTTRCLFGRKFDTTIDANILDRIDREILDVPSLEVRTVSSSDL